MRKNIVLLLMTLCCMVVVAQNHRFAIGLENTEYGYVEYSYKDKYITRITQSIFIDSPEQQCFRIAVGYRWSPSEPWRLTVMPQYGAGYSAHFYTAGLRLLGDLTLKHWSGRLILMPYYDSTLNYNTCYDVGAFYKITSEFSLGLDCTNIPEYRDIDHKMKLTCVFKVNNLEVSPQFSVPIENNFKHSRVLLSFKYEFR